MSCENCEESAYVIDKLTKLLAEIAVIVNGPEPPLTSWSYHDLPEKVRALKQSPPAAVPAGYALVPVEPTTAMKCRAVEAWEGPAAYKSIFARGLADLEDKAAECWDAMLAAARGAK